MRSDLLNIHDEDPTSDGGPPGWLAFAVVTVTYFVVLGGLAAYCIALP